MSQDEIAYWLSLTAEQINAMLKECDGIDDALQLLEKIGHIRAWYIYSQSES